MSAEPGGVMTLKTTPHVVDVAALVNGGKPQPHVQVVHVAALVNDGKPQPHVQMANVAALLNGGQPQPNVQVVRVASLLNDGEPQSQGPVAASKPCCDECTDQPRTWRYRQPVAGIPSADDRLSAAEDAIGFGVHAPARTAPDFARTPLIFSDCNFHYFTAEQFACIAAAVRAARIEADASWPAVERANRTSSLSGAYARYVVAWNEAFIPRMMDCTHRLFADVPDQWGDIQAWVSLRTRVLYDLYGFDGRPFDGYRYGVLPPPSAYAACLHDVDTPEVDQCPHGCRTVSVDATLAQTLVDTYLQGAANAATTEADEWAQQYEMRNGSQPSVDQYNAQWLLAFARQIVTLRMEIIGSGRPLDAVDRLLSSELTPRSYTTFAYSTTDLFGRMGRALGTGYDFKRCDCTPRIFQNRPAPAASVLGPSRLDLVASIPRIIR